MENTKYELILVIVNNGFADSVMDAAREAGATGGTVINARGTAKEETLARFKVFMTPEKEMVLIVCEKKLKENILKKVHEKCGLSTDAYGIAFALPIDDVVGLKKTIIPDKE
jgi:nitrogen regulatory protein PII